MKHIVFDVKRKELLVETEPRLDFQVPEASFESPLRAKTSLRLQYEAQAEVLKRQMGGLKGVQDRLQLSARKISQLLLVDPSAWSRWLKDEASVPPHIWRALHWYFAVQDKLPGLTPQYFLGRDDRSLRLEIEGEISQVRRDLARSKRLLRVLLLTQSLTLVLLALGFLL